VNGERSETEETGNVCEKGDREKSERGETRELRLKKHEEIEREREEEEEEEETGERRETQ
jgi:hypothetical protein